MAADGGGHDPALTGACDLVVEEEVSVFVSEDWTTVEGRVDEEEDTVEDTLPVVVHDFHRSTGCG